MSGIPYHRKLVFRYGSMGLPRFNDEIEVLGPEQVIQRYNALVDDYNKLLEQHQMRTGEEDIRESRTHATHPLDSELKSDI